MRTRSKTSLAIGTILLILILIQVLAGLRISTLKYLPTPIAVITSIVHLVGGAQFWQAIGHTAWVAIVGWLIGSLIAVIVGVAVGLSRHAQNWSLSTLEILRAIPVVAVLPVMVIILGLTTKMELYLVVYACLWPVLVNTIHGVTGVKRGLLDVGKTLRLTKRATVFKVVLPSATSQIAVGLNLSLIIALVVAVIAEIIATPAGVGHQVTMAQSALNAPQMFAYIGVSGLMGIALSYILDTVYRFARPGLLEARR